MSKMPSDSLDEAYFDRNQAFLAFGRSAVSLGWVVGVGEDPDAPDWPVLYIEIPGRGQVSWHLPSSQLDRAAWPPYEGSWDNHDLAEKRAPENLHRSNSARCFRWRRFLAISPN
jgi:hypothetical protein